MKTDFVAITSHELRTPLAGIRGFVDMLLRRAQELSPAEREEFLRIVLVQTDRLIHIVDDLLVVSRIEADALVLEPVEVEELAALLRGGDVDVIDVRELDERDSGFIPGSKHIPYRLLRAYGASVADGKPVVTICESGARAAVAASVLAAAGVNARAVIHGGIADWQRAGGHTVEFRRCGS